MPHSATNEIAPTRARDRTPLTYADKQIVADVLTWDCQRSVSAEEIETIAITHNILWVKLTDHRAVPISVHTFRSIRRQQLEQQSSQVPVADVAFVMEMEAKIEADAIELDQADGASRVWRGTPLVSQFHRETYDWFATPVGRFKW